MNILGSNREYAENKLILLYIMEKIKMPLGNLQITKLVMERNLMNYFLLQQFLNELCSDGMLASSAASGMNTYTLTKKGSETLHYFLSFIPYSTREQLDITIAEARRSIRHETRITADFVPESENEFTVQCRIGEDDFSLLEVKVTVGTRSDAKALCEHWKKHSQEIYNEIIESLMKDRPAEDGVSPDSK